MASQEVGVGLDQRCTETSFPQRARALIALVEMPRVRARRRMHRPGNRRRVVRRHQQVHVVAHEHVRVDRHPVIAGRLFDAVPKEPVISLTMEDALAVVPPVGDVGRVAGNEMTRRSSHMDLTCRPGLGGLGQSYLTRLFKLYLTPFFLLLTPFFLAGCSLIDPHNMIGRQVGEASPLETMVVAPPKPETLSGEDRQRAFDFVWRTINEHYYNEKLNGVDWKAVGERYRPLALAATDDEAFWDTLDRMTGELMDAHTRVESPKRVELRKREEVITLGFTFIPTAGKLAVATVNPDADAR